MHITPEVIDKVLHQGKTLDLEILIPMFSLTVEPGSNRRSRVRDSSGNQFESTSLREAVYVIVAEQEDRLV